MLLARKDVYARPRTNITYQIVKNIGLTAMLTPRRVEVEPPTKQDMLS